MTLDTLRIVVLGNSVAWGLGLVNEQKLHALVPNSLQTARGNVSMQITMLAHSGANIGVGDATVLPALDGEVPTSYPTVLGQVAMFDNSPDTVDLVIVIAGLNDINVRNVLNPTVSTDALTSAIRRHCLSDMKKFCLERSPKASRRRPSSLVLSIQSSAKTATSRWSAPC